jgi:sigma-E factor negative regulatory protein RseC
LVEEQAVVVDIDPHCVWVETQRQSACGQCAANKGCGTSALQKVFGNKRNILPVTGDLPVAVGDKVVIGIDENSLVKGSIAVYAMPLVSMIAFAVAGETVSRHTLSANPDIMSIAGAMIGLLVGITGLRWYSRKSADNTQYQPILLRHAHQVGVGATHTDTIMLS